MRRVLLGILLAGMLGTLHAQESLRMAGDRMGDSGGGIPTLNQQGFAGGEQTGRDSTVTDRSVPRDVKMFHVGTTLGNIVPIETDTAVYNFQNLHFADGLNGEYNYLGNMGSPRQSRIFFNRPEGQFVFTDALDFFLPHRANTISSTPNPRSPTSATTVPATRSTARSG